MIILLYLIVITGWALLILVIKCRKAREKRIALERQAQIQRAVHVIQIGNQFYDVMPISHCHHSNSRCRGYHIRESESNSHINPTFVLDEGIYPSAPASSCLEAPPSYDDVIRLPNQYPKRITQNNENPPPTLEEIERGSVNSSRNNQQQQPIFTTSQEVDSMNNRNRLTL